MLKKYHGGLTLLIFVLLSWHLHLLALTRQMHILPEYIGNLTNVITTAEVS